MWLPSNADEPWRDRVTPLPRSGGDEEAPTSLSADEASAPDTARILAALQPSRRGVRALATLAVLVVCIAAFIAWRSRPQADPLPAPVAEASPASAAPDAGIVVVAVAGRVQRPGLVRLPDGSRVADAIDAAGGVLPGTDLSGVNLARKLVDGELVLVGVTPPPGVATPAGPAPAANGAKVNLNTATLVELQTLPGIGEVLAQRIIDHRTQRGAFRSINDLRQIEGIGEAKFAQLRDRVTV